jgi:hypothetical protein
LTVDWLLQTMALIMIIFVNVLSDKNLSTNQAFTALLLMAFASTPKLRGLRQLQVTADFPKTRSLCGS